MRFGIFSVPIQRVPDGYSGLLGSILPRSVFDGFLLLRPPDIRIALAAKTFPWFSRWPWRAGIT
jgi:hypothetical protein